MKKVSPNRTRLQKLTAKGFVDPPRRNFDPHWIRRQASQDKTGLRVALYLPTLFSSVDAPIQALEDMPRQLAAMRRLAPQVIPEALVAIQTHEENRADAIQALAQLLDRLAVGCRALNVSPGIAGVCLSGFGKVNSLNALTVEAERLNCEAVFLLDDDIELEEECLARLATTYAASGDRPLAVGACKIGLPLKNWSSRFLHRAKSFTRPAENYPHACCMIVSLSVLRPEIPPIFSSDDGYVCFELLAPGEENPLRRLRLLEDARCRHFVGGEGGQSLARIRRMLIHHHLFLSHYDINKARYYAREMLFYGFWPYSPPDFSNGLRFAAVKWILKFVYGLWFMQVWAELIIRGLVNKPISDISWGGRLQPQIENAA